MGTQGNLNTEIVGNTVIPIPTYAEQREICIVLSNLDSLIDDKEITRQELISIKSGLMQDLLTGKVRVKVN